MPEGWYIEYLTNNRYRHVYIGKPKERNDKDCKDTQISSLCPVLVRDYTSSGTTDTRTTATDREPRHMKDELYYASPFILVVFLIWLWYILT